ncbi:two component transcriptional regulator, LuxR family [Granulicella pectinivorans]|uniref:Two component transcriptional regulator, LuxR family n=1 Tax=Granulicella pectinivorans TaxID=474950 RepID=A0A1I6LXW7_9BACT|nr:response regulator transcription factor [Granulicella pectinivorans]SFS08132.1 two component transcriptional regulator, LuxR family [Granulicella pectinivorans]
MSRAIRILIAEDHPLMRSGIIAEISAESDLEVVATAEDGQQAVELFRVHQPDISLIDIRLPKMNGLQVIEAIRLDHPSARVIVLTTAAGDAHAVRAFKAGAASYLLKHMLRDELIQAIRDVHAGKRRIPTEVAKIMAESSLTDPITGREIEVLARVAEGLSNKEIAAVLFISEYTVKAHLKTILQKLGANDRTHAVMIALQRGFLDA